MAARRRSRYLDPQSAAIGVLVVVAWACTGLESAAQSAGQGAAPPKAHSTSASGAATTQAPTSKDPCRYVAASDAETYTGPLATPPFRATGDAVPSRSGENCLYRGVNGREILVDYFVGGARAAGTAGRRVPAVMDRTLHNGAGGGPGSSETQGPANAIMGPAGPGPWDNSNWFPTGTLIVYKNDDGFSIDVSATSAGKDGALDLATRAINHMGQPLTYDGSKAVAQARAPDPRVPPCDLVPRAKAEGILGTLAGAPVGDNEGNTCTYKIAGADGEVSYPIAITWTQGYKQLNTLKRSMSTTGGLMGASQGAFDVGKGPAVPAGGAGAMPAMPAMDPAQAKMFNQFAKGVGVGGASGAVTGGMKNDSTLTGPWDAAALINGMWLVASKHDVAVTITVGAAGADIDKAKALLAAACTGL